ncbi:Zinc binding domain / DNA primase [Klebsiella quasipneumoniae]|jgi:putative DNA primase/helicase|nr:Zinc binding domain / DNA primase [Klebsiella quasipneumoniae]
MRGQDFPRLACTLREVTGLGDSGKSILVEIATMLAGEDNATSADIDTLEDPRKRASLIGFSLIRLPD